MFRIVSIDWGSRLAALVDTLKRPRHVLTQIGALLKSRTQQGFKAQGRPDGVWASRAVPNVPGILRDFHQGSQKPKSRRFEERPALIDEGVMLKGVNFEVKSDRLVEIGMTGPAQSYVDKQHFGGETTTDENTPEFKAWLWDWLKSAEGSPWKGRLGYLLNKNRLGPETWNITARPIFVLLPEDVEDVATETGVQIMMGVQSG